MDFGDPQVHRERIRVPASSLDMEVTSPQISESYYHAYYDGADPCRKMQSSGSWRFQRLGKIGHAECSKNVTCREQAWVPNGCTWHVYHRNDSAECLKNHRIHVIGDSRSRHTFRAMVNRLDDQLFLQDDVSHETLSKFYEQENVLLDWQWMENLEAANLQKLRALVKNYTCATTENVKQVLILQSFLLHPTWKCPTKDECYKAFETYKTAVKNLLPNFYDFLSTGSGRRLIWVGHSDVISNAHIRSHPAYERNTDSNKIKGLADVWTEKTLRRHLDPKFFRNWAFLSANRQMLYSRDHRKGWPLTADGTHLMPRRVNTTLPTTLWAQANLALNFLCNRGLSEGADCCL